MENLVDPASSHMLVSKPSKKVSGSIPPGSAPDHTKSQILSTKVGNPTSLHTEVGFLVRRAAGPGSHALRSSNGPGGRTLR